MNCSRVQPTAVLDFRKFRRAPEVIGRETSSFTCGVLHCSRCSNSAFSGRLVSVEARSAAVAWRITYQRNLIQFACVSEAELLVLMTAH